MAFPLPTDFNALFHREPYRETILTGRNALARAVLIISGMLLGALVLPQLPRRPFFRPKVTGKYDVVFGVAAAVLIGCYYLYKNVWQPWRDGPAGYRLVGEFEVREKDHLFSKYWVRLIPGENFKVQIEQRLYERLRVGSHLRLIYTAEGEQFSVVLLP